MPTSSSSIRTYGKKSSAKRKQNDEISGLDKKDSLPSLKPLKRQRLSVELRNKSPSPSKTDEDGGTDAEDDTLVKAKPSATYTLRNRRDTLPSSSAQKMRAKPVRDLSGVFDNLSAAPTPVGTPSKLAKRMLGRSRTESFVESQMSPCETQIDRTSSLPNLPPSPSHFGDAPRLTSKCSGSVVPSNPSKPTTRTYAGKYRSFLMAIPADTSSGSATQVLGEEELEQRESYNILRTRWGVDNSEDDPHPFEVLSQTKSISSASEVSPLRKGKSKALASGRPPAPVQIGSMNYLKSISELRNKGEGRRFLDEVGYLFEGLDAKAGIGLRRASMLEIITKLCDANFTRKAIATDFFPRTWDLLLNAGIQTSEDKILDLLAVCFLVFLARDPLSLSELAERSLHPSSPSSVTPEAKTSVLDVLTNILFSIKPDSDLLVIGGDPSKLDLGLKQAGLTKKDRTLLVSTHKVMATKSDLFAESTPLSTSLVIAYTLHALPSSLLLASHLRSIISSLRLCLSSNPSTTLSATLSSQGPGIATSLPHECLYYHIKLVDTFLSRQRSHSLHSEGSQDFETVFDTEIVQARDSWMAEDLVSLGVCLEQHHQDSKNNDDTFQPDNCLISVLRMLVSLTHADEQWSRNVLGCKFSLPFLLRCIHRAGHRVHSSPSLALQSTDMLLKSEESHDVETPESPPGPESNTLDILCLALGLLTNLVQVVEELKDSIRMTRLNPSCSIEKAKCLSICSCFPLISGIDILASLYAGLYSQSTSNQADTHADPEVEAESSFLRGHLAVLFGLLMIDNPDNQSTILSVLPTISPNGLVIPPNKRKPAATAQDNRIKLSRLVDQARDFVVFYTVINRKFGGEGEVDKEKESRVAKEVVLFLESLRDQS
ncbi:hypothetical protein CPB83DRAFT_885229 [Crepidotus variabilis]|uniref:Wings apart-like protein C-terminal domain-containing protein n=1 Tax=Crepidotus variabilis TaxID=179855 RepID=A0A9P6EAS7_9AGAR|nr:hypothetical protein CPB83DRAFT_885229 [Crepidotus variabilis]